MKYAVAALLAIFITTGASAQKDVFWGDGGISLARLLPGASLTYNHNVTGFLGLGAGAQLYDFHATKTNFQPIPALFWDVRCNVRSRKKNQYCLFLDAGLNIYKRNMDSWQGGDYYYRVKYDDGTYYGMGFGYFKQKTDKGWGHYVTMKFIFNHYQADAFNIYTREKSIVGSDRGTIVISYGFKF